MIKNRKLINGMIVVFTILLAMPVLADWTATSPMPLTTRQSTGSITISSTGVLYATDTYDVWKSTDGTNWTNTNIDSFRGITDSVGALTAGANGSIYALLWSGGAKVLKYDGSSWTDKGFITGLSSTAIKLLYTSYGEKLIVGAYKEITISGNDGTSWGSAIQIPGLDPTYETIKSMDFDESNAVYIALQNGNGVAGKIYKYRLLDSTWENNASIYSYAAVNPTGLIANKIGSTTYVFVSQMNNNLQKLTVPDTGAITNETIGTISNTPDNPFLKLADGKLAYIANDNVYQAQGTFADISAGHTFSALGGITDKYLRGFTQANDGKIYAFVGWTEGGGYGSPKGGVYYYSTAPPVNNPPTVNAGTDATCTVNQVCTLTGTASDTETATDALTKTWSKVSPSGTLTINNSTQLTATFTPTIAGSYVFRLTVSDGTNSPVNDDVSITVSASAPTCSSTTQSACTQSNCATTGAGYWCTTTTPASCVSSQSVCTISPTCSSTTPTVCTTQVTCESAPGKWCTSNNTCIATSGTCPTTGTYCCTNADCPTGKICGAGQLCANPPSTCTTRSDCPNGQACFSGTCTAVAVGDTCSTGTYNVAHNSHCPIGTYCSPVTKKCTPGTVCSTYSVKPSGGTCPISCPATSTITETGYTTTIISCDSQSCIPTFSAASTAPTIVCGNRTCEVGENSTSCPTDCPLAEGCTTNADCTTDGQVCYSRSCITPPACTPEELARACTPPPAIPIPLDWSPCDQGMICGTAGNELGKCIFPNALICTTIPEPNSPEETPSIVCGNGTCETGENNTNCSMDCPAPVTTTPGSRPGVCPLQLETTCQTDQQCHMDEVCNTTTQRCEMLLCAPGETTFNHGCQLLTTVCQNVQGITEGASQGVASAIQSAEAGDAEAALYDVEQALDRVEDAAEPTETNPAIEDALDQVEIDIGEIQEGNAESYAEAQQAIDELERRVQEQTGEEETVPPEVVGALDELQEDIVDNAGLDEVQIDIGQLREALDATDLATSEVHDDLEEFLDEIGQEEFNPEEWIEIEEQSDDFIQELEEITEDSPQLLEEITEEITDLQENLAERNQEEVEQDLAAIETLLQEQGIIPGDLELGRDALQQAQYLLGQVSAGQTGQKDRATASLRKAQQRIVQHGKKLLSPLVVAQTEQQKQVVNIVIPVLAISILANLALGFLYYKK